MQVSVHVGTISCRTVQHLLASLKPQVLWPMWLKLRTTKPQQLQDFEQRSEPQPKVNILMATYILHYLHSEWRVGTAKDVWNVSRILQVHVFSGLGDLIIHTHKMTVHQAVEPISNWPETSWKYGLQRAAVFVWQGAMPLRKPANIRRYCLRHRNT